MSDLLPRDPLESPVWEAMAENYLKGYPIVFDPQVVVGLPPVTEDQTQVPITIDARALGPVDEVVVITDLNPFPVPLKVRPRKTPAFFAFRVRVEQGTAVRAAVRKDGRWHVGARYLDAAGGGCSAPPEAVVRVDWDHVGQMRGRIWRESADTLRLRLRIVHPMDTGLHKEPAYFIQTLQVKDHTGAILADMDVFEPIASDPVFTLLFSDPKSGDHVTIAARDNDGQDYQAKVALVRTAEAAPTIKEGRL